MPELSADEVKWVKEQAEQAARVRRESQWRADAEKYGWEKLHFQDSQLTAFVDGWVAASRIAWNERIAWHEHG